MIKTTLQQHINEAMKARDQVRVLTLKMLSSELHNAEIDNYGELSEEQEFAVLNKEVKKRRDAIEAYEKGGAPEKAEREKEELMILEEFMPAQLSDEEINKLIDQAILAVNPQGMQDMGKMIGAVKELAGASADGGRIASLVKAKLQ